MWIWDILCIITGTWVGNWGPHHPHGTKASVNFNLWACCEGMLILRPDQGPVFRPDRAVGLLVGAAMIPPHYTLSASVSPRPIETPTRAAQVK